MAPFFFLSVHVPSSDECPYEVVKKTTSNPQLLRQLSAPLSKSKQEFITKVLPQPVVTKAFSSSSYSSDSSDIKLAPLSVANVKNHELTYVSSSPEVLKVKKYQDSLTVLRNGYDQVKDDRKHDSCENEKRSRLQNHKGSLEPIHEVSNHYKMSKKDEVSSSAKEIQQKNSKHAECNGKQEVNVEKRERKCEKSPRKERRNTRDRSKDVSRFNKNENILLPDYKVPAHDYETIIYSGGNEIKPKHIQQQKSKQIDNLNQVPIKQVEKPVLKSILKVPKFEDCNNILLSDRVITREVDTVVDEEHKPELPVKQRRKHHCCKTVNEQLDTKLQTDNIENKVDVLTTNDSFLTNVQNELKENKSVDKMDASTVKQPLETKVIRERTKESNAVDKVDPLTVNEHVETKVVRERTKETNVVDKVDAWTVNEPLEKFQNQATR
jgi:hypothetical protein